MTRLRLAAGVALAVLAGWWAREATRQGPEPGRTAFVVAPAVPGPLARSAWCECGHIGDDHDPDLGCVWIGCRCRRPCLCPGSQPPGDR